jgi:hypothetical protein
MPMPWLASDKVIDSAVMQSNLFNVLNYTRINPKGLPTFTLFSNIPSFMSDAVQQKWHDSVQESPKYLCHPLYDHYELVGKAVHEMRSNFKLQEMMHGLYVSRFR